MGIYQSDRYSIRPMREATYYPAFRPVRYWEYSPPATNGEYPAGTVFGVYRRKGQRSTGIFDYWLADCGTEADARQIVFALEFQDAIRRAFVLEEAKKA